MSDNSSLPIQIKLQVGTVEIALAQLLELGVDQVSPADAVKSYFPQVRAIVGERAIAEGELVNIDGKVGFRVTKVL
jgi:flagellar motor switch/type III secretory pathway protein FliN